MIVEIFASTDVGHNYTHNEDNFAICRDLSLKEWVFKSNEDTLITGSGAVLVVADGMGGSNAGEIASHLAQQSVRQQFNHLETVPSTDHEILHFLKKTILQAHEEIVAHQGIHLETAGMGTTLTVLWVFPHKSYVAWCGDSRLYVYRENTPLTPYTADHSFVWELVKTGELTPEQARVHPDSNIITQNLGTPGFVPKPDTKVFEVAQGDRLLLCSDGLNSMLSDEQINTILSYEKGTMEACKRLVEEANRAGGQDNITVILLDVKEEAPVSKPITISQEFRRKNRIKNIIIGVMAVLLITALAFAMYKLQEGRKQPITPQFSFVVPLYGGEDTTLHATYFTKQAIDSMHINKPPRFGAVNQNSSLSFIYHPAKNAKSKADSIDLSLYNSKKQLSEVHLIFTLVQTSAARSKKKQNKNSSESKDTKVNKQAPAANKDDTKDTMVEEAQTKVAETGKGSGEQTIDKQVNNELPEQNKNLSNIKDTVSQSDSDAETLDPPAAEKQNGQVKKDSTRQENKN